MKEFGLKRTMAFLNKDDFIKKQATRNQEIVYGSQSIKAQIGPLAREPGDWDLLSPRPARSARMIEKTLDRASGGDYYYTQASDNHKGTYKVKELGPDNRKGTDDDLQVADYTKPSRRYETKRVGGLRVVKLGETVSDKLRSLKDKEFAYRFDKDSEDVNRINFFKRLRIGRG